MTQPTPRTGASGGNGINDPPAPMGGTECQPEAGEYMDRDPVKWDGRDSNYRSNLTDHLGNPPPGDFDAHHIFPVEFGDRFALNGIDANNPRFGTWADRCTHQGFSAEYSKDWRAFLAGSPSYKQILDFGRIMGGKYGFDVHF